MSDYTVELTGKELEEYLKKRFPAKPTRPAKQKYTQNLRYTDLEVYSYNTLVANIDHERQEVKALGWWSVTTSKHINYVASELGYKVIK